MSKNFAKLTENVSEIPKYTGKCRKCQKYSRIFDIWRYMSKITIEPSIKWPKFDQYLAQIGQKWLKKWSKITKIIPEFFTSYQKWPIFGLSVSVKNVLKYLVFFSQKAVHFPKNLPKFKTLTGMHGLSFNLPGVSRLKCVWEHLNRTSTPSDRWRQGRLLKYNLTFFSMLNLSLLTQTLFWYIWPLPESTRSLLQRLITVVTKSLTSSHSKAVASFLDDP